MRVKWSSGQHLSGALCYKYLFAFWAKNAIMAAMNQEGVSPSLASVRRCPNCGTRVAQNAETCYFCGHDLTKTDRSRRRITWRDLVLVLALLLVVVFWWRMASNTGSLLGGGANAGTQSGETSGDALPITEPDMVTGEASEAVPLVTTPDNAGQTTTETFALPNPLVVKHEVKSGETLFGIAGLYGITVEELQLANNLQNELIRPGDALLIPVAEAVAAELNNQTVSSIFKYRVLPGDTVVSIAIRFGTQVETILKANNLIPTDFIRPAQTLLVPVEQVPSAVLASSESARGLDQSGQTPYAAPQLLGPQAEETLPRSEQILFRWISVDLLAPNEWYVLRIWPLEGTQELPPTIWTKSTSYRLDTEWAPPAELVAKYGWQVTVVRILPDQGNGREIQAASAPSQVRTFIWR